MENFKVLVACEESQAVTIEFRKLGVEAYSNDIQECSGGHPEWHIKGDCFEAINLIKPVLLIAHPPCTYLSYAGIRWFNIERYKEKAIERHKLKDEAINFFLKLYNLPINYICIENPRGYIQEKLKHSQIIQPYYFGDSCSKTTLLWLKNLPKLIHTKNDNLFYKNTHVYKGEMCSSGSKQLFGVDVLRLPQKERAKLRSKTFQGIARAMAEQWTEYLKTQ